MRYAKVLTKFKLLELDQNVSREYHNRLKRGVTYVEPMVGYLEKV